MQKAQELNNKLGSFSRKRVQEQVLTFTELQALAQIPSHLSLPKKNDKLLECILLMAYLGLRVSEAINFTWQQIKVEDKMAFIVQGKGNKQRLVFNLLNNSYIAKKSKAILSKSQWTISRMAIWNYLQKKYAKKVQLLDEEQLANNKLTEKIKQLETELRNIKPSEWTTNRITELETSLRTKESKIQGLENSLRQLQKKN